MMFFQILSHTIFFTQYQTNPELPGEVNGYGKPQFLKIYQGFIFLLGSIPIIALLYKTDILDLFILFYFILFYSIRFISFIWNLFIQLQRLVLASMPIQCQNIRITLVGCGFSSKIHLQSVNSQTTDKKLIISN